MKCKKLTSHCIAKEHFMKFRNLVFETTDRILTSFVKFFFFPLVHDAVSHDISDLEDGTNIMSLNASNRSPNDAVSYLIRT